MTCDDFQRQLHLSRDGELTPDELEALRRHIATCERCTAEQSVIEGAEQLLSGLRLPSPSPRDPEALTARIMLGIRPGPAATPSARPSFLENLFRVVSRPTVRYAYASIAILALGSFLYQSYTLFTGVEDLQERLASGGSRGFTEVAYVLDENDILSITGASRFRQVASAAGVTVHDGRFIVDRKSLSTALTRAYQGRLLPAPTGTVSILQDDYQERLIELLRSDVSTRLLFKRGGL